jgi:uncharacterized protein
MKLSKLNRITHRDIGYLIAGLTIIYSISGIALNHKHDWNPNYLIDQQAITSDMTIARENASEEMVLEFLDKLGERDNFKTYYFPSGDRLTIFLKEGSIQYNVKTGDGYIERVSKRPLFYQFNFLHYNPGKWWKWFSDIFCLSLITVTVTGLFLVKGKNGITRRGAVLTMIGLILPLIFLLIYSS